jgi:indole-3-glycerol phosphate synthase
VPDVCALPSRLVTGSRRFSQAISEGKISLVAAVEAPEDARGAEGAGAEAVLVWSGRDHDLRAIREATSLPILFYWDGERASALEGADACLVEARGERDRDLVERAHVELGDRFELALQIEDEEHLASALEDFDPEVFVLAAPESDDEEEPLERVLDLLPDVPAGKLAVAQLPSLSADDVAALERAGVDGVIVRAADVALLARDA